MTTELALLIALFFLSFIFILMDLIVLQKWALKKEQHLQGVIRDMVFSTYMDGEEATVKVNHRFFFDVNNRKFAEEVVREASIHGIEYALNTIKKTA